MPKSTAAPADTSALLTHEQIDEADDLPEFDHLVPEWPKPNGEPGLLRLRGLSYEQLSMCRTRSWNAHKKETDEKTLNAWCLALGVTGPSTSFAQAMGWMNRKKFGPVNTILSEILKASGLGAQAVGDAKSSITDESPESVL